ncbi:MAG: sulfatase-like hydrolase/transferase, partial [Rikenellaceae bacterium]
MKKSISLLFFSAIGCCSFAQSTNKPNIVVIIADDCMYQDLGCYGSNDAITPNIDKLASEGMRFTNFHQSTAMSSPTRHCIMTGLYPFRSGAYPNHTRVFDGTKSIVHYLKD